MEGRRAEAVGARLRKGFERLSSPGNNLEKLKGAVSGKYSSRVNDQYRIIFNFDKGDATNVVITDYHR